MRRRSGTRDPECQKCLIRGTHDRFADLLRRNNNSSRFGKFLTLQFSASGRMQGAYMKTYLLEKSRITSQLPGEQNYHVLYQASWRNSRATRSSSRMPCFSFGRSPRACQMT